MPGHHLLEPEGQWESTVECGQECPTHSDFLSLLVKAGGTSRAFLAKTLKHRPSWITQSSLQAFALEKTVGGGNSIRKARGLGDKLQTPCPGPQLVSVSTRPSGCLGEERRSSSHQSCHRSDNPTPGSMAALRRTRGPLSQLCLSVAFTVYSVARKINTSPFPKP